MTPQQLRGAIAATASAGLSALGGRQEWATVADWIDSTAQSPVPEAWIRSNARDWSKGLRVALSGLDGLQRFPEPPKPESYRTIEAPEWQQWWDWEMQLSQYLSASRQRLKWLLHLRRLLSEMRKEAPEIAGSIPKASVEQLGRELKRYGVAHLPYATEREIWLSARGWPHNARKELSAEMPWQDASGWEE